MSCFLCPSCAGSYRNMRGPRFTAKRGWCNAQKSVPHNGRHADQGPVGTTSDPAGQTPTDRADKGADHVLGTCRTAGRATVLHTACEEGETLEDRRDLQRHPRPGRPAPAALEIQPPNASRRPPGRGQPLVRAPEPQSPRPSTTPRAWSIPVDPAPWRGDQPRARPVGSGDAVRGRRAHGVRIAPAQRAERPHHEEWAVGDEQVVPHESSQTLPAVEARRINGSAG